MSSEPQRERLPFEPTGSRSKPTNPPTASKSDQKAAKPKAKSSTAGQRATATSAGQTAVTASSKTPTSKPTSGQPESGKSVSQARDKTKSDASTSIPKVVSNRMARRMIVFSGVPTALGCLTFVASYFVVTQHWLELPNTAVVLVSMAFFGLGVLGLSYGILSASWEESAVGSLTGWSEFNTNIGRMAAAWRASRNKQKQD